MCAVKNYRLLLVPEGDAHEAGVAYGLAVRVNVLELAGRVFQGDRVYFTLLQDNQAAEGRFMIRRAPSIPKRVEICRS